MSAAVPESLSCRVDRPLVVYDGACGFCRFWIERWRAGIRDTLDFAPFQKVAARFPQIPRQTFEEAMQVIEPDGRLLSGADAVFRVMAESRRLAWISRVMRKAPPLLAAARGAYRFIARHRTVFSLFTRAVWGRDPSPATFAVARRIFAHGLGLVFFSAFASLLVQVRGLIGAQGIMPAADLLPLARAQLGGDAYRQLPTLFWLGSSDTVLLGMCVAGVVLSAAMACGFAPGACAVALWVFYLSFSAVSSPFLDFQWDSLLLETALISAVFLPWRMRPRWALVPAVASIGRWLILLLLFRLMLESGLVKLASGDPTWRNLTAMTFHYETQPLPLPTAWWAHHAPLWLLQLQTLAMFAVEFLAPFGIFAPRRLRHIAAWAMIALQGGILLTGNYAFFNWLTILLCVPMLDDTHWPSNWRKRLLGGVERPEKGGARWPIAVLAPFVLTSLLVTAAPLWSTLSRVDWPRPWAFLNGLFPVLRTPAPLAEVSAAVAPLRSFNAYGLFAVMTTERPEIVVEGSSDGQVWQAYKFRWKPGDVRERPRVAAPHQPRLDWQMWFAALGDARENPWFIRFLSRLLDGAPEVLALLESNPFPNQPPRYIRAVLYDYHFTKPEEGPAWWRRDLRGLYCPPLSKRAAQGAE